MSTHYDTILAAVVAERGELSAIDTAVARQLAHMLLAAEADGLDVTERVRISDAVARLTAMLPPSVKPPAAGDSPWHLDRLDDTMFGQLIGLVAEATGEPVMGEDGVFHVLKMPLPSLTSADTARLLARQAATEVELAELRLANVRLRAAMGAVAPSPPSPRLLGPPSMRESGEGATEAPGEADASPRPSLAPPEPADIPADCRPLLSPDQGARDGAGVGGWHRFDNVW
jgi:hypothetical protein